MGWIGIGAENIPREDLYFQYIYGATIGLRGSQSVWAAPSRPSGSQ